jgi:hypothetical protein
MDGWLSMVFLGPKAICESCLFIWASGFHSLEAELEAQPNKASRLTKKRVVMKKMIPKKKKV